MERLLSTSSIRDLASMAVLLCLLVLPALVPRHAGAEPAQEGPSKNRKNREAPPIILQPLDLGLEEEAGVRLVMLEVEVLDKEGNPVPGLTMDDFQLILDGKRFPLVAVDDFCACEAKEAVAVPQASASATTSGGPGEVPSGTDPGTPLPPPRRFVLLIDFSQIQLPSRKVTLEQVRYWFSQVMQDGDEAMLSGFSTAAGLREITPFTSDADMLLQGLDAAFDDPVFLDPFPTEIHIRRNECNICMDDCARDGLQLCERGCCSSQARDEALQSRRSLEALDLLLTSLESVSGRKDLIVFNQNGMIYPARLYSQLASMDRFDVGDHQQLAQSVAASATASRTTLHIANIPEQGNLSSPIQEEARDLGTRLADYTGGTTNRSLADMNTILAAAGRRCCMYKLSIGVPDNPPNRPVRARVMVRGNRLPGDYRVQFYTAQQRWFRQARAALVAPSRLRDPDIRVTMAPTYLHDNRWVVEIQTAFALADLELVPGIRQRVGRWRVGALLETEDGNQAWEMFCMARATLEGLGDTRLHALHQRRVGGLEPGSYRLRLFVEDAQRNMFGAGQVGIELPGDDSMHSDQPWLFGPTRRRRVEGRLDLGLPFVSSDPPVPTPVAPPAPGAVPMDEEPVVAGTQVEFHSVLCPRPPAGTVLEVVSILLRENTPLVRLPAARVRSGGRCATITDQVDTMPLPPADYTYRMIIRQENQEPITVDAPLTVQPAEGLLPLSKSESASPDMRTQKP